MRPGQRAQIAVSSLGGFRTPAARACGIVRRGRHPKTFTHKETYAVQQKLLMVFQPRLSYVGQIGRHGFLGNFHNSRQPDRKGRAAAGLALDRDVAAHHLTEAPADHETKAGPPVFARC